MQPPSTAPRDRDVSVSFERINSLCEDFAAAWKQVSESARGDCQTAEYQPVGVAAPAASAPAASAPAAPSSAARPSLDSYLTRVSEDARPSLLRNMLAIEIDCLRGIAERPQIEEYLRRFPQFATLIREAFLSSSAVSSSVVSEETAKPKVAAGRIPVASRLGEYRLLGELGRGGMGVVYEALHVQRGNRVALKTLPTLDGSALHRFKREFRALADINHPNLVGLHTLEAEGDQWFFTMDLVEGVDFLSYVRPAGVLDEVRLRSALAQLIAGVMALHGQHIIHRDLKPSNVMVARDGHVVVMDFGLVAELDKAGASGSTDKIAGTPRYMAPEQAAGTRIAPASDWYALGVMLYEALCDKAPFSGSLMEVLHAKQHADAPPLPEDAAIPDDLAALCMHLLQRDPQQRPDALEIAKTISSGVKPASAPGGRGGHHLVGRDQQLGILKDACRTLERKRAPLTLFISGRSGEGKSTLGEHFLAPLGEDKQWAVMSGRCYDRESVPFKALDTLIDALCSYLRSLPGEDAALLMPDDIGALVQVFPVLQRVEVVAKAAHRLSGLDDQQVRRRAFGALRSLLGRISRRSLIVWFIDDLQWGDADSAEALFEVLRPPEPPSMLFLGAYRSDETDDSAFLRMWKELQRKHDVQFADREIKLSPLTVAECIELVIGIIGKDDDNVRRRAVEFAQETRGNPFLLIELIGCFDPETDSFEPMPLHEVLAKKLERLPADAGPLLDVVAVSGHALSLAEAAQTAGHALPPVATITRMRNERLVRMVGTDESPLVDTYHDRVRETVLGRMEDATCKSIHRTLAEVIEKGAGGGVSAERVTALESGAANGENEKNAIPRIYDLAYHFDAAGDKRKAWVYGLLAAEQARRQSALEVAVNNYALAKRNAAQTAKTVGYRIAVGCGEALMLLGRYEEANKELDGVADLAPDAERKARIELLQGEIALKQGAMDKSVGLYEQGLRRLGHWVPRSSFGYVYAVLRETVIQFAHSLAPWRLHRKAFNSQSDLAIRLFFRLTHPRAFQNTLRMLWTNLTAMNRAELFPKSPRLSYSYAIHSCMISMLGWQSRGRRFGDRALEMSREFDDVWGRGQSCNYKGIGLYAQAHYEEGLARLGEAIDAFEKSGDLWEVHLAHFHKGCCHYGLGDLAEAVAEARWTFAAAARLGDSRTLCSSWLWARATRGNIPFEEIKSCYPCRPDDIMSTVHGVLAEGHWHSFHGRTAEALETFERAADLVRKTHCVNSHTILVIPMLAGALRKHADAVESKDAALAGQLRKRAYRAAKWATRLTWLFPAAYPLALRERSLILVAYGKTWKALKFADKSCARAEAQKAQYEHAQSLLVRGKLAKELGLPEADEQIRTAEAAIEALERPLRSATAEQQPARK